MGKSTKKRHLTFSYKQYMRKYYQEHKDTILANAKKYNQEHKEEMKMYLKSWCEVNRDRIARNNKKYYHLHKDEILAKHRAKRLDKLNNN